MLFFKKMVACGRWTIGGLFLVAGCSTIQQAHDAQKDIRSRGLETARGDVKKLNLRAFSLSQLVDFALTNRPSVVAARLAVKDARLAMKEIAADAPLVSDTPWTAPHLSVNGGYTESSAGTHVGGGEGFRTSGNASFGLSLDVLIYDFGRYDARAKAQAERVVSSEQQLVNEGYTVFGEVCTAYFNFIQARSLLDVAFTNRADYAEQLELAEAMLQAGESRQLDVLRAKVDLANAEQEVVAASNEVDTCGATFMYALGIDVSRGTAHDVLDDASIPLGTVYRGLPATDCALLAAYDLARTNAPDLRIARAKLRAASHDVDYAIANMLPQVSASTSFSWSDPLWFWSWGASAVQSVFEGFRKTTAVDRAVVAMQTAATSVDAAEHALSSKLEAAIAVRDNAAVAYNASVASVRSARENLEMVTAQYAVGDATRIDLSAAVAQNSTAVGDCIKAFYYNQRAETALYALMGIPPAYQEEKLENVEKLK